MNDFSSLPKSTNIEKQPQISIASKSKTNNLSTLDLAWTRVSKCQSLIGECCVDNNSTACRRRIGNKRLLEDHRQSFVEGNAIFCIPDLDSTWFQGYFTRFGNNAKPIGLLVIQNDDTDECLRCSDGGYKELTLRLCHRSSTRLQNSKDDITLENIICTGGDMMQWRGDNISFCTERLWTGPKAIPMVEKYFGGLVQTIHTCSMDETTDVNSFDLLQWLPNVIVNVGTLKMTLQSDDARDYWANLP
jgi:hypothetical protein